MMEAVSTIMGINFFSGWKLFSTSTLIRQLTDCSQHCRRVDRGVYFFCGSPSLLWFDPRLHLKSSISYLPSRHLLSEFSLCIYSCPPSQLLAWAPSRNRTIFWWQWHRHWPWQWLIQIYIDIDNIKSKERWKLSTLRVVADSIYKFFERYLNI